MNETELTEAILTTLTTVLYEYVINGGFLWDGPALFYEPELVTVFSGSAAEVDLLDASDWTYVEIDKDEWEEFLPRKINEVPTATRRLTELVVPLMAAAIEERQMINLAKKILEKSRRENK